jgi:hypothetical protein
VILLRARRTSLLRIHPNLLRQLLELLAVPQMILILR